MLNEKFKEMPLNERLDAQIEELKEIVKLYTDLVHVKKQYDYDFRLQAAENQLQALFDLRNGDFENINDWAVCYEEDMNEYKSKNK
jgi:hypothetical protein